MSTIHLVYAHENRDLAEQITQDIGRVGIPFQHHTDRPGLPLGQLAAQVKDTDGPVILLVTDNFFKNRNCMAGALSMFKTLAQQNRLLSIVADGRQSTDGGKTFEPVPTEFDRVVHAIQYMNYWQAAYLDRNAGLPEVSGAEKPDYERELEFVRNIANEIGEMFSALREAKYYSWEALKKEHYALFFRHFQLQEWHEQYKNLTELDREAPAAPPVKISAAKAIAEAPVVSGPLVPAPTTVKESAAAEPSPSETPHFNGIDTLLESLSTEEAQPEEPEQAQEKVAPQEEVEHEIRQTSQDAWFWIEKGHTERGLELFRLALEQYPANETLQAEYQRALEQQQQQQQPAEKPSPEPRSTQPTVEESPPAPSPEPAYTSATDRNQEADSYLQMGENALAKGDYLLAKYCWDRVTELQPDLPGTYRKLALLTSEHLTDYKETTAHYLEQALAAEPDDADLHYRLAMLLHHHLDQPGKALQHFRDAVVSNPDHGQAWLALAQITHEAGDHQQASSLYQHALEVDATLQSAAHDALFAPAAPEPEPEPELAQAPDSKENPEVPEAQSQTIEARSPQTAVGQTPEPLTVLITGASSGIGRATAELFARHGHRLILTGRRVDRLEALQEQFTSNFHNEVKILPFDIRNPKAAKQQIQDLPEDWQNIDLLINNAGLAKGFSPIHEGELEHWEAMIDTNLKGLLYVTRLVAPGMVKRQKGHIINVGSGAGKEVYPNGNVYCATKFAVDGLTRAMRLDLYTHNIRVSQISPAHVEETEFALTRFDGDTEKAQIYKDFQPLKSSDVAEVIYFIATRPAHVNIQDLWVLGTQQASSTQINRSGR